MQRTSMLGQLCLTQSKRSQSTASVVSALVPRPVTHAPELLPCERCRSSWCRFTLCGGIGPGRRMQPPRIVTVQKTLDHAPAEPGVDIMVVHRPRSRGHVTEPVK